MSVVSHYAPPASCSMCGASVDLMRAQYDDAGDPLCGSCQPRHTMGSVRPGRPGSLRPAVELQRKAERERTIILLWAIIAGIFVAAVIVYMGVFWK